MINFRNVQQCRTCGGAKVAFVGNEGERELRMVNYCEFCLREKNHREEMILLNSKYRKASSWLFSGVAVALSVVTGVGFILILVYAK